MILSTHNEIIKQPRQFLIQKKILNDKTKFSLAYAKGVISNQSLNE
jgi:hypothetical protein